MPKLTNALKKGLTLLAGKLPEATDTYREKVLGGQLLSEGIVRLPGSGEEILVGVLYGRTVERPVNHEHRLLKAFKRAGRAGVLAYCTPHIEPEHLALFSAKLSELVPA